MATYFLVNIIFLVAVAIILRVRIKGFSRHGAYVLIALLLLTAVFDSLIVSLGIVDYNPSLISGITIGSAPIEDFFYALLAAMIVPKLWRLTEKKL